MKIFNFIFSLFSHLNRKYYNYMVIGSLGGKVMYQAEEKLIIKACLLAGKILIQSGAETYRAEDTMVRMAAACGYKNSQSFVTPTTILFSLHAAEPSYTMRISERGTDLEKIALVNQISRQMAAGILHYQEAYHQLKKLERANLSFPIWPQILSAAIASGCFLIMYKGIWSDFLPATFIGGLGFATNLFTHQFTRIKFFAEFTAAFLIGLFALIFIHNGWGMQLDLIVIASVMPLVPGLLITNAIRDLMAGHFVSGVSKSAEAFLTALAIGAGVAVVYFFWF